MPNPVIYPTHAVGSTLPAADWNNSFALAETSLLDFGAYVVSGLALSIGTGLSVNVSAGHAVIGADITASGSFAITGLSDGTTNHLYLMQNGTTQHNTTGIQPAASTKLGTAVCAGGVVTSVAMGRNSGRQQWVAPVDEVPGGPSAGTPSAGHMASLNLANWSASPGEGVAFYGVLPVGGGGGGGPATIIPPLSVIWDNANQATVDTALTIGHTYNAGGGAAGIGVRLDFAVESSTPGTNRLAANLQATLTNLIPANATGMLAVGILDNNVEVIPMTVASKDTRLEQAVAAASQHGLFNLGSGGFNGSAGHFAGDSPGTILAMNAPAGYGGTYVDIQKNGVRLFYLDTFGTLFRLSPPVATGNDGQLSLGPDIAHFDGSSAGHFVGTPNGTYLAINTESGFAGDLVNFTLHGAARFKISNTGSVSMADSADFVFGTSVGTRIGTVSNQRIGFWGHSPVVRPAAYTVANGTTDRALDVTGDTLAQVAAVLGTLIGDLQGMGLLG